MKTLHFTTVSNVQRTGSDERYVSCRGLPNLPCGKKRIDFKEEQPFSQQPFSAALLSSFSQQLFSATLLSSFSQQLFSAAFLISFLSSLSQHLFSAAFLSSFSQQLFSAAFLSSFSQQLFSAAFLSSSSQQPFSAAILSYHLAVVRGWRPAINIILLWSGVGGQLLNIILLWSGVGGQLWTRSLKEPFRNAFREKSIFWCFQFHDVIFWIGKWALQWPDITEELPRRIIYIYYAAVKSNVYNSIIILKPGYISDKSLKQRALWSKQIYLYIIQSARYDVLSVILTTRIHPISSITWI